jgi:hypothetical protein
MQAKGGSRKEAKEDGCLRSIEMAAIAGMT